jgi:hypothetical protein
VIDTPTRRRIRRIVTEFFGEQPAREEVDAAAPRDAGIPVAPGRSFMGGDIRPNVARFARGDNARASMVGRRSSTTSCRRAPSAGSTGT